MDFNLDLDTWHYYQKNELCKTDCNEDPSSSDSQYLCTNVNKLLLSLRIDQSHKSNTITPKEPESIVDLLLMLEQFHVKNTSYLTDPLFDDKGYIQQKINFYRQVNKKDIKANESLSSSLHDLKPFDLSDIEQTLFYEIDEFNSHFKPTIYPIKKNPSNISNSTKQQQLLVNQNGSISLTKNLVVPNTLSDPNFRKRNYEIPAYNPINKYICTNEKVPASKNINNLEADESVVYDSYYEGNDNYRNNQKISNNNIQPRDFQNNGYAVTYKNQRRPACDQNSDNNDEPTTRRSDFITAKQQMSIEQMKKGNGNRNESRVASNNTRSLSDYPPQPKKKVLGQSGRARFNPPLLKRGSSTGESSKYGGSGYADGLDSRNQRDDFSDAKNSVGAYNTASDSKSNNKTAASTPGPDTVDERIKNVDPKMIEIITNEIMHNLSTVEWDDIAGLEHAKKSIMEIVVWPMLRPDVFSGLRGPPKGLLLFGPPGTGKTLIGKCIASQSCATFFSISSSTLTSKWVGEGEKMVKALFAVARMKQPSVIFIDEIDSLLTQRTDGEMEATRRIKTEFLVQFDGCGTTTDEDRILVIGATNRPQEIDEAARRRFRKRLYIPLPGKSGRQTIISNLLKKQGCSLSEAEIEDISIKTEGYSGSDMDGLCREAALGPIRALSDIKNVNLADIEPISHKHFIEALKQIRASVSQTDLQLYLDWDASYGSMGM
ncbi:hypothetical protein BB561_002112 [Smittium simulii]|uniref:AAA+ ATPase domain-containing protein n=1 Tax=Smittium simulii TaxID=133385 RepID=A0A2T9YRP0_9FUNG|nr:hypothetical protein BB561_002112 [Smittium simulii]